MFFRNTWPAFLWAVVILVLTLFPAPAIPEVKWINIPHADKIVHAGLFGVQYFLLMHGLMKQRTPETYGKYVLWIIVIVILFGAATEILQAILPSKRDADIIDWLADCVGTMLAVIVYGFWRSRKKITG